jgi:cytochrome c biogenesis protein CcmG/thiol:disulfide interchange protein DsbE
MPERMSADTGAAIPKRGSPRAGSDHRAGRRSHAFLVPVVVFVLVAAVLALGLGRNPRLVPSPLVDKPVPEFRLPPVLGRTLGLSNDDLRGQVSIVNVFASWCVACRAEHPLLMALARDGSVPIHGLNYKDQPKDAAAWLDALGDPYSRTGADLDGRVGIDWGVYGVPETFVIDAQGRIAFKQIGPITPAILDEKILPLVSELRSRFSSEGVSRERH